MSLRKSILLVLLLAVPSAMLAQSNYRVGYVIKNSGDTVKGYIDYREWVRSPRSINFKAGKSDKNALKFFPSAVKGFVITGMETYISFTGWISTNPTHFPDLPAGLDTSKRLDTIFLRQVATGPHLTLYYHGDNLKTRFFAAEANGNPVELKFYYFYNTSNQAVSSDVYKGQLVLYSNRYAPGNVKLTGSISTADYDETHLEPLVDAINDGGNASKKRVEKKSSGRFYAGISLADTRSQVDYVGYVPAIRNYNTVSPKINAGIDLFNNPNVQQFIFRAELSLSYITPRFSSPVNVDGANVTQVYEFNQYTASVTPQLLLNVYNRENFKFYLGGGIAFNFSAYSNNKVTVTNENSAVTNALTVVSPYKLEPYWASFPVQAGIVLNKKTEFCLTYLFGASYTKYSGFYASNQSVSVGVKFLFGQ